MLAIAKQMGDKNKLHDDLYESIRKGLGDCPDSRWNNIKSRLRKANTDTDFGVTSGQTIVEELIIPCNIKDQVHNLINLCTEYDDGLFLLKNACVNIFPSGFDKMTFVSSIQKYALELDNQPKLKNSFASLVSQNHTDLTWIDDLNQTSLKPARRVVEAMSRPGEPLALDDIARQFLQMLPHEDFKSVLKQILGNKLKGEVDDFRRLLFNLGEANNQTESI